MESSTEAGGAEQLTTDGSDPPPAGVLAAPPPGTWHLERLDPAPNLVPYVAWLWSVEWDLTAHGPHHQATLPHPSAHLTIETVSDVALLYGPTRSRFDRVLSGVGRVVAVRFQPAGLYPFVGCDLSSLVGKVCPADRLLPEFGEDLASRIGSIAETNEALAALGAAVGQLPRDDRCRSEVERINAVVDLIANDRTIHNLGDLSLAAGIHRRALQRDFARFVGLGPKTVIRRYRLQEVAAAALSDDDVDWAAKAVELGYYDQAHLVGDFTRTIGTAPATYGRSKRRP